MTDEGAEPYRYSAFISYSRSDLAEARKIHRRLERYAIPRALRAAGTKAKRLRPVFLDVLESVPGSALSHAIKQSLIQSEYLIVLCSEQSRNSFWVDQEIKAFLSLGRRESILAVAIGSAVDGDGNQQPVFLPPALTLDSLETDPADPMPLWADLRSGRHAP